MAAAVLVPRALHSLHPLALQPSPLVQPSRPTRHAGRVPDVSGRERRVRATVARARQRPGPAGDASFALLERVGIKTAAGVLVLCALMLMLVARRVWRRGRREYALYELHLSTHDQAKGQDLEDMVESIANIVRAWPAERIRNGQPYLALELICGVAPANGGPLEMEWSINIRCEPQIGERARRRDQRHLPRRPTRPHPRRATAARGPACCANRAT